MFQLKRSDLSAALELLAMAPEKSGIPSSEYLWVRGKGDTIKMSVAGYLSGEATLTGEGEWPFDDYFFIDRRTFTPWVHAARESKEKHRFQFHKKGKQLLLKHGIRTATFANQTKISGYGDLSKIKKHANHKLHISSELRDMLRCGRNCATSDTINPALNAVYTVGNGSSVVSYAASDYVFYIGKGKLEEKLSDPIPFPLFLINLLTVEGLKKISCSGKYIVFYFKHGVIWQPVSIEASSNFPIRRIRRYSKRSKYMPAVLTTSSRRFSKLIMKLGYYMQSIRRRDWVATISGKKNEKVIYLKTEVPGSKFMETIDVSGKVFKDFKIDWPLETLVPVFEFLSKHTKKKPLTLKVHSHGISYVKAGPYWMCIPSKNI